MSFGFGDLVLCPSTVPSATLEQQAEAAASAGCAGISVRPAAACAAVERLGSLWQLAAFLRDTGVQVADLDAVVDWRKGGMAKVPHYIPREGLVKGARILEMAEALGARSVNLVDLSDTDPEIDSMAEDFAAICDRAQTHGLLVHAEFFEGSSLLDLATTSRMVELAGASNGGVLLDTFHYHRGPSAAERQLAEHVEHITMLQLSDCAPKVPDDHWAERQTGRLLPGEGVVGLADILAQVARSGVSAPIGLEVNNAALHGLPPAEAARLAANACRKVLASLPS